MTFGRVMVTGLGALGWRVAERLVTDAKAVLVATSETPTTPPGTDPVRVPREHRALTETLVQHGVDTVIHTMPVANPHGNVITTMLWATAAAAAHRRSVVRRFVMLSSAAVYPASSAASFLQPEHGERRFRPGSTAENLAEAEQFARDLAVANPHLPVAILRCAELVASNEPQGLAALLRGPIVPALWGFDPSVQFLHVDDAVDAIEHAVREELAGIYNVAGEGTVRWRRAARLARKPVVNVPAVSLRSMARLARLNMPDDLVDVLRFGRAMDTDAMARAGFVPFRTSEAGAAIAGRIPMRPTRRRR